MIEYYTSTTIIICILMVAMSIHVLTYSGFNRKQKTWFVVTFMAIMFCSLAEFAVHCGYYNQAFAIPLTILTIAQFSISPCLAMLFCGALGLKHQGKIAGIYFGVALTTEIICAPFGAVFSFGADGYSRGPAFILYEIFYFVSLIYLLTMLVIVGRRFRKRDIATIIMIILVLVAGIIPMTAFKLHVAYAAIGIASCLCYIYYNDLVQQDTKEALMKHQKQINRMQRHIISGLASLIESRDTETGEHVSRTSKLVKMIAVEAINEGLYTDVINDHFVDLLYTLAPMHDIGKIVVSDTILRKPGKLTPEEYEEMKKHAAAGGKIVREILDGIADEEEVNFASDIAACHHERWDGNGYPNKLKAEEIPLCARIMAIADVFDALISKRCYKDPFPFEKAIAIIEEQSGTFFDPKLVEVFLKSKEKYRVFCVTKNETNLPKVGTDESI